MNYGYVHAQEYTVGVEDISYFPIYDFSEETQNRNSFTKELLRTFLIYTAINSNLLLYR